MPGRRRWIERPVPTGTVLFITSACSFESPSSESTASTRDRSASPEYVGGVSTQTNSSRVCSSTSAMSVVKWSRAAFFATSSGRPGSWIGTSPRVSESTFSATMSRAHTSWPSSARQAAVTRPTQPTPMTPIGSRSAMCGGQG